MNNITFDQLPQAVSMLIEKVGLLTERVEKFLCDAPSQHGEAHTLLSLNEVAKLLGKSASTIYESKNSLPKSLLFAGTTHWRPAFFAESFKIEKHFSSAWIFTRPENFPSRSEEHTSELQSR